MQRGIKSSSMGTLSYPDICPVYGLQYHKLARLLPWYFNLKVQAKIVSRQYGIKANVSKKVFFSPLSTQLVLSGIQGSLQSLQGFLMFEFLFQRASRYSKGSILNVNICLGYMISSKTCPKPCRGGEICDSYKTPNQFYLPKKKKSL